MAGNGANKPAGKRLVGPLDPAELLALADKMAAKGVLRFEVATGMVEFSTQVITMRETERIRREQELQRKADLAEVGDLAEYRRLEKERAKTQKMRDEMGSA